MLSFIHLIERNISSKKVLILFILTNLVYIAMLGVTIPNTMEYAKGMKLLDMIPTGYDWEYVNELFTNLGEEGRSVYLTNQIPLDMIYPLLFGASYCLLLGYFLKKLQKLKSPYSYLCLFPIIAGFSDYLENIGIIMMLKSFPEISATLVNVTNTFSITKSVLTSLYFVILTIVLISFGIQAIKERTAKAS